MKLRRAFVWAVEAAACAAVGTLLLGSSGSTSPDSPAQVSTIRTTQDLMSRATAAVPDLTHGAQIYAQHCIGCHRSRGNAEGDRQYPQLGGQQERYLLEQLVQFVTLGRYAPKMHQILTAADLADPQTLRDLSAYLAAQPHDPHGEHGDAHRLGRGRQIYDQSCAECHGARGEGRAQGPIPAISGQNYTYLLTQLEGFAAGHRSRAEPAAIDAVRRLSRDDIRAVADFISRMPASLDPSYGVAP
ncbi:MAG TPA: c-type cytochrome [Steroidobacteraceae bacterium]|nr:c-type cytochrome [Steroidobacteraceae bacterium]